MVTKKTKKSETTFDMKPYIYEVSYNEQDKALTMTVDASSSGNIKPSLVVKELFDYNSAEFDDFGLLITREETYTTDFKPLGAVGSDY
jgi:hypothetical protein